jgi:polysaccharide biosynthesis/export protein
MILFTFESGPQLRLFMLFASIISLSGCALPGLALKDYPQTPDTYATSHDARYLDAHAVHYKPVIHPITPALVLNLRRSDGAKRSPTLKPIRYSVQSGDSLYAIARRFKVSIADLRRWNNLQGNAPLHPGQAMTLSMDATPVSPSRADRKSNHFEYRVGPGDVLSVIVWEHPNLTTPVRGAGSLAAAGRLVQADGTIFFPFVGIVKVAGLTVGQIRRRLTDGLKHVIREPQIDVRVLAYRSKYAFVVGSVGRPCRIAITDRPLTIVEALNQCKTITKPVVTRSVRVVHDDRWRMVDLQDVYLGRNPFGITLHAGDRIYVNHDWYRVFMVGEFRKQKTLPIPTSGLSLSEAIAGAGGLNLQTADSGGIYVIRGLISEGKAQADVSANIYHLDASSVDALLLADQFRLQPRDVVFAAAAGLVNFNRAIAQILPTVQLLFESRFIAEGL